MHSILGGVFSTIWWDYFVTYRKCKHAHWEKVSDRNASISLIICVQWTMQKNPGILTKAVKGNPSGSDLVFGAWSPKWGTHSCLFVYPGPGATLSKSHHMIPCPVSKMLLFERSEVRQSVTSPLQNRLWLKLFFEGVSSKTDGPPAAKCKNADLTAVKCGHRLKSTWIQWARKEADGRKMIRPSFHRVGWLLKRPLSWFVLFFVHWC